MSKFFKALEPTVKCPDAVDEHLVSLLRPTSFEAEQYRALRHMMERWHNDPGLHAVAVTSPSAGDGKTTTAINLAGTLAQGHDARVLLVDADLRRPCVAKQLALGHAATPGLVDAVLDPALSLEDVVRLRPPFSFGILPAGRPPASSYEVLTLPRLAALLDEARQRYDYIVVDTPPLVAYPDCHVIGKWVDGYLMVVAAYKTPRKLVAEALSVMDAAKIVGLVFNSDDRPLFGYSGYYYNYHESPNGKRTRVWGRAPKKVGGFLWRRGSPLERSSK
ncbi:MAG: CpsD/CapB family tyrosine-protein kinase [Nitrospinae bacterium]|nr:CpsD/CapB family tyrosine-protein kinase [Nitrospinota bacterium]